MVTRPTRSYLMVRSQGVEASLSTSFRVAASLSRNDDSYARVINVKEVFDVFPITSFAADDRLELVQKEILYLLATGLQLEGNLQSYSSYARRIRELDVEPILRHVGYRFGAINVVKKMTTRDLVSFEFINIEKEILLDSVLAF